MPGPSLGRPVGRQRRLAAAQRAYGALPPAQRRVLVLRYVDGLEPAAIAARLGMAEDEVETLVATARNGLLRAPRTEVARPLALAAVAAAFALTLLPDAPTTVGTPAAAAPAPGPVTHVVGGDPLAPRTVDATSPESGTSIRSARVVRGVRPADLEPGDDAPRTPSGRCKTLACLPKPPTRTGDVVQVPLPDAISQVLGQSEIEVRQDHVPLCSSMPAAAPNGVARCVPGST